MMHLAPRAALAGLVTLAAAATTPTPVPAQESFPRVVRIACTADAKRLCPAYRLGSNEMRNCMEAKARLLSRGCVRALEDAGMVPRNMLRPRS
jgi:hypothetical protein